MGEKNLPLTTSVILLNQLGLHTRPATLIVKLLHSSSSSVFFTHHSRRINAKSILNLLTLAAKLHDKILIEVDGEDAKEVIDKLELLFSEKFGEM